MAISSIICLWTLLCDDSLAGTRCFRQYSHGAAVLSDRNPQYSVPRSAARIARFSGNVEQLVSCRRVPLLHGNNKVRFFVKWLEKNTINYQLRRISTTKRPVWKPAKVELHLFDLLCICCGLVVGVDLLSYTTSRHVKRICCRLSILYICCRWSLTSMCSVSCSIAWTATAS